MSYTNLIELSTLRRPGVEPGPRAWKARILTVELSTLLYILYIHPWRDLNPHTPLILIKDFTEWGCLTN